MFNSLAAAVTRHWLVVILGWILLAAGLKIAAPAFDDVAFDGDLAFLPDHMPSIRGSELLKRAFPERRAASQVVLVLGRPDGQLEPGDHALGDRLAKVFRQRQVSGEVPILDVWTPNTDVVGKMLQSRDGRAVLVVLQLSNEFMATDNIRVLAAVDEEVRRARGDMPPGLELGITGSAAIGGDMLTAAAESIRNTEKFTLLLVVLILLVVYRAPLLLVVPLTSIAISLSVATDLIALLTQVDRIAGFDWWHFKVFKTTKIFIVVILYGAGTDYCLFLISRYKEELARGVAGTEAVARALGGVGSALAASALTTVVGLGTMYFADFGKFSNSGPAIALALTVATMACMTLAPAILVGLGRTVFWPYSKLASGSPGNRPLLAGFWEWASHAILARPGAILLGCVLLMAPWAYAGLSVEITYDLLSELEHDRPSVRGTALMRRHFNAGETGPLTVLARSAQGGFETREGEKQIARLTKYLFDIEGVSRVRSVTEPTGDRPGYFQPFTREGRKKLAAKQHPLTKAMFVTQAPDEKGHVARFDLILEHDPFSREALDQLEVVDAALGRLPEATDWARDDLEFELAGTTAGIRDLKQVTESDRRLIQRLVVIAVLAVLLAILRHPLVCVYLIVSVLWTYFVTIGMTELFFGWYYGDTFFGLDWKVPMFLFVILVAVGADYNIYLVTRVFEEQDRLGLREGLRQAVVATGGIITSCGVIMAGTFLSMMTGTLRGMLELGFALSLGVVLDTFVVRPILVPAMLAILARARSESPDHDVPAAEPTREAASARGAT